MPQITSRVSFKIILNSHSRTDFSMITDSVCTYRESSLIFYWSHTPPLVFIILSPIVYFIHFPFFAHQIAYFHRNKLKISFNMRWEDYSWFRFLNIILRLLSLWKKGPSQDKPWYLVSNCYSSCLEVSPTPKVWCTHRWSFSEQGGSRCVILGLRLCGTEWVHWFDLTYSWQAWRG